MMIKQIDTNQSSDQLYKALIEGNQEVGMIEFNASTDADYFSIPSHFQKLGNFEIDILAIDANSGEVILLDHEDPNHVMGKVSLSLSKFIEALKPIEATFESMLENEDLYDDENALRKVAKDSSSIAGSLEYLWFYNMMFGI